MDTQYQLVSRESAYMTDERGYYFEYGPNPSPFGYNGYYGQRPGYYYYDNYGRLVPAPQGQQRAPGQGYYSQQPSPCGRPQEAPRDPYGRAYQTPRFDPFYLWGNRRSY